MEGLRWKVRIALLWVLMLLAVSAHSYFITIEPGGLEKMISSTEAEGFGGWLFLALFCVVPLWLAFLSLTLKTQANRWVNFVLGIIFTIMNIIHFFECGVPIIAGGPLSGPTAHHILLVGTTVVATGLIAWYAWRLPKQEA